MKIAIVNYRYFISGGPERYLFNITDILEKRGHDVIQFSVKHKNNKPSKYNKYFLSEIGNGTEIYNHEYPNNFITIIKSLFRMLYSFEAKRAFNKFLKHTKPDIIYILQFQNKISCSIIDSAVKNKIPIIQRISDFGHICPNAHYYRENYGICELCTQKGLFQAVKNKCISESYVKSILKASSLKIMEMNRIKEKIDAFIFPSTFTKSKYILKGFEPDKCYYNPTFFNFSEEINYQHVTYDDFALYIGRIEKEKGIETLIEAFKNTSYNLKIIGFSNDENYINKIKKEITSTVNNIELLGKMQFEEISNYLQHCLFTIVPSEWYENFPNTILESFAFKKPVIATKIGSITEIINDTNGYLFEMGSPQSLKTGLDYFFNYKHETILKGQQGYFDVTTKYNENQHYDKLLQIINKFIK